MTSENRQTATVPDEDLRVDLDHNACCPRRSSLRDARFDGRFFTGRDDDRASYRRPVCPARTPRSENVDLLFHAAAAAQEASAPAFGAGPARRLVDSPAGNVEHGVPGARADRARGPGRGQRRRLGRPSGAGRAGVFGVPVSQQIIWRVAGCGRRDSAALAMLGGVCLGSRPTALGYSAESGWASSSSPRSPAGSPTAGVNADGRDGGGVLSVRPRLGVGAHGLQQGPS